MSSFKKKINVLPKGNGLVKVDKYLNSNSLTLVDGVLMTRRFHSPLIALDKLSLSIFVYTLSYRYTH